jgi:hypothetical protein
MSKLLAKQAGRPFYWHGFPPSGLVVHSIGMVSRQTDWSSILLAWFPAKQTGRPFYWHGFPPSRLVVHSIDMVSRQADWSSILLA